MNDRPETDDDVEVVVMTISLVSLDQTPYGMMDMELCVAANNIFREISVSPLDALPMPEQKQREIEWFKPPECRWVM